MTNKEAIKILRKGYPDIKRYATIELGAYEYDVKAYNEALTLAIKALEEVEERNKLKLICANEGIMVYKVKPDCEVKKNDRI